MEENSCTDSSAPLEFNTEALIASAGGLTVAVERCPLCSESKRPFYCKKCVETGRFSYSNATYPDSYEEKQRKWDMCKSERDHILERCEKNSCHIQRKDVKTESIEECRRNIELLKLSLSEARQRIKQGKHVQLSRRVGKACHERTRKENLMRYSKGKKHREKERQIKDYLVKVKDAVDKKKERLTERHHDLMELRQKHITDLTNYIFEVAEVKSKGDSLMGGSDDVREALQEASQTAYVRGRWIYSSSQFRIVAPTLPSHGEYAQYNVMVAKTKEDGASAASSPTSPGNSIIAGLCYTSQLVAVITHILGISLPKRQCYSDFCVNDLSEKQFNSAVARLNKNVLYLCFSQGVDVENIEPKHTLHNILLLLRNTQLGRIGSFDVVQDMMDSVEDSNGHSEESDDDGCHGYDEPDTSEWESVPDNLPVMSMPQEATSVQTQGYMSQQLSESTFTASGVLSSFTSFFRR